MRADTLFGLPVVTRAEQATLGRVIDVLVDPEALRVEALLLERGADRLVLSPGAIQRINRGSITVERAELARMPGKASRLRPLSSLTSLPVGSRDGDYLGDVAGLEFDLASGNILSLAVRRVGLLGVGTSTSYLGPRAIWAIGDRLVSVEVEQLDRG